MQPTLSLYPPLEPFAQHQLKVDKIHHLYVEQCGNPNGLPILYVHGGPGTGCSPESRQYFDPKIYHIILFDQRGAGRSIPHANLENNTTQHLIRDMEAIRNFLKIEKWILFGGSWGSTLSLVYAETFPSRVMGLILRGIFLARQQDLNWLYCPNQLSQIFPDHWQEFIAPIRESKKNLLDQYYDLLTSDNNNVCLQAAKSWSKWEAGALTVQPRPDLLKKYVSDDLALSIARIECHYMINQCFLKPNQILKNIAKIKSIPGIIIHGRYDMVCVLENAWSLHQVWPQAKLHIIPGSGHSASEPGIAEGLIRATQKMAADLTIPV